MKFNRLLSFLACIFILASCTTSSEENPADDNNNGNTNPSSPTYTEKLPDGVVLGEKTFQLNNIQLDNLIKVDEENSTLTFSSSLSDEHIPQKGDILLQYHPTETLPYGFLGQVTKVTKSGSTIIVETEAPMLDEAFEKLYYNYEFDILPEESRALIETDEDGYTFCNPEGTLEFACGSISGNLGIGGRITMLKDMDVEGNKNDTKHKFDIKLKAGIDVKVNASGDSPKRYIPLIKNGINLRTAANAIGLKVVMIPCCTMKASGKAGFQFNGNYETTRSFTISSNASTIGNGDIENTGNNDATSGSSSIANVAVGFYLDGSIFAGATTKFQIKLFGRDDFMVEISPEFGTNFAATLPADFAKLGYTSFKDTQITTSLDFGVDASAKIKLAKWEPEWTVPLVSFTLFNQTNYLFPDFTNGSYEVNGSNVATGSIQVERDLFWKNDIAIGKYDKNDNLVEVKGSLPYQYEAGFSNPLTASFTHNEENSYWSVIKWGGDYLKCVELKDNFSIVGTWSQIGYQYHDFDFNDHESFSFERGVLPWIFYPDGTGVSASLEGEQDSDGCYYDNKEEMYWEYQTKNNILKLTAKDPNLYEEPIYWRVNIKTNDKIELVYDAEMDGDANGNWYEMVILVRETSK